MKENSQLPYLKSSLSIDLSCYFSEPESKLSTTLNCNKLALKCLRIKGNQLDESVVMFAAGSLLHWFDQQLNSPVEIVETALTRTVSLLKCIHFERCEQDKSFTSYLSYENTEPRQLYNTTRINRLFLTDQWLEPIMDNVIPRDYLKEIKENTKVYQCLIKETGYLFRGDARAKHLHQTILSVITGVDKDMMDVINRIGKMRSSTSDDLTSIWRNIDVYRQLIHEHNPLFKFLHTMGRQRLKKIYGIPNQVLPNHIPMPFTIRPTLL